MVFIVILFFIGLFAIAFMKDKKSHFISNQPCKKGHKWQEVPVDEDEEYFFLKCQNCQKTLAEVLKD